MAQETKRGIGRWLKRLRDGSREGLGDGSREGLGDDSREGLGDDSREDKRQFRPEEISSYQKP